MKLTNTSKFFQHRMKSLFSSYLWQFVFVYIDDIIIYFSFLIQHIQHLDQLLTFLKDNKITLTLIKCHFVYFSIHLLKHHVFKFDLNIIKKKIKIIWQMKFSINFKKLKIELNFFDYYKFFVNHFVNIVKFLIQLKIRDFKNASIKNHFKKKHSNNTLFDLIDQNLDFDIALQSDTALSTTSTSSNTRALSTKIASSTIFALSIYVKQSTMLNIILSTTSKCFKTWKEFKKKLCTAFTLVYSDFFKFFVLYVDDNKKKKKKTSFCIKSIKTN